MSKVISNYSELLAAVGALPKPAKGMVRVFRGQTADYPLLAPTGLRQDLRAAAIWQVYSHHLYVELAQRSPDLTLDDFQAFSVWFGAISQHYGPGSDFLDVTHSLDIALWFALNKSRSVPISAWIGPDGPFNPATDHPMSGNLVGYDPWNDDGGGYLYVFDIPPWDGEGLATVGQLVDLAKAPEFFSSSPRMRAQAACMVYCRNDDSTLFDIKELLVEGTPLRVRRPMTGTLALDLRVADIYPSPRHDEWFARFLSVPMTYAAEPQPPVLQRSIPVTVYYDDGNVPYLQEVHFHDVLIQPPLVHRVVQPIVEPSPIYGPTTIILLEAPMIFPYPPADSDTWHHGLLWADLPDSCAEYAFDVDGPTGEVPLSSVFFEFSLLEEITWERSIHGKAEHELLRGVWLRRDGDRVEAAVLLQTAPNGEVRMIGFFALAYDADKQRIVVLLPANGGAVGVDQLEKIGKSIIVALMLLRNLSPKLKCQPMPMIRVDRSRMIAKCTRDTARLYRVTPPSPNPHWYVLRDATVPGEPFTSVRGSAGEFVIESPLPFRELPLAELRNIVADR